MICNEIGVYKGIMMVEEKGQHFLLIPAQSIQMDNGTWKRVLAHRLENQMPSQVRLTIGGSMILFMFRCNTDISLKGFDGVFQKTLYHGLGSPSHFCSEEEGNGAGSLP
jgi:hypothetical protein